MISGLLLLPLVTGFEAMAAVPVLVLSLVALSSAQIVEMVEPTPHLGGVLYPRASETREVLPLDGVWNFKLDSAERMGFQQEWFHKDLATMEGVMFMPVPSSYNDITTLMEVREHVGYVWYERKFFVSASWREKNFRVWLRFGSVNYFAHVWVNGKKVMEHEIGHLPFVAEITNELNFGEENKLTVAVDNVLTNETVPQGILEKVRTIKGNRTLQKYSFDFFNYAGIHRPVHLYTTPTVYIDDVELTSDIEDSRAYVNYNLYYNGQSSSDTVNATVSVIAKNGSVVCFETTSLSHGGYGNISGRVECDSPQLWWPYLMHPDPGYLYTVQITLNIPETGLRDIYRLQFGLRSLTWDNTSVYINKKPIYIRGFGRHEDSDFRGKGLDLAVAIKDHNLLKWIGANSYRTSHYPYAEEIMDIAESEGFMIIDEAPSVNTEFFSKELLRKHENAMREMINRDKNRACVIMWSVANEPRSDTEIAGQYFKSVVSYTRTLDTTRPITAVLNRWFTVETASPYMDIICFNRYNAWYKDPGQLDTIQWAVQAEASRWRTKRGKPVLMSEFGADTYEGYHSFPEYIWSEEYQIKLLSEHFKAFDYLRKKQWFIGEMIWNFADFKTDQSITRVGGNKKGIFTRQRAPKSSAFIVRKRNFQLASALDGVPLPADLERYTSDVHLDDYKKNEL